ncbi:hypothetical protein [Streptomyces shenzhenensis]|uniref:hypothetical protein n=1 Tax=Streptomyces shenzhenensis TaxID=943815 RepID=UPI003673B99C
MVKRFLGLSPHLKLPVRHESFLRIVPTGMTECLISLSHHVDCVAIIELATKGS